jgi:hypothetical protein
MNFVSKQILLVLLSIIITILVSLYLDIVYNWIMTKTKIACENYGEIGCECGYCCQNG